MTLYTRANPVGGLTNINRNLIEIAEDIHAYFIGK